jgi:hypothetical protein
MGLSLEFYAGDAATIGADFTAFELNGIRDGRRALAYADFSLHLSPTDLDILSEVIAERTGARALLLNECLIHNVGGSEGESGADVVDPSWVRMIAALSETAAPELAAKWIGRVGAECGQELEVTSDAVRAVQELVRLCKLAVRDGVEVVHTWYL